MSFWQLIGAFKRASRVKEVGRDTSTGTMWVWFGHKVLHSQFRFIQLGVSFIYLFNFNSKKNQQQNSIEPKWKQSQWAHRSEIEQKMTPKQEIYWEKKQSGLWSCLLYLYFSIMSIFMVHVICCFCMYVCVRMNLSISLFLPLHV